MFAIVASDYVSCSLWLVKFLLRIDDALDLFAEHALGGVIGLMFNAFFAKGDIIALDNVNTSITGGWLDHNWKQLYIQFAYVCATCSYTFVMTALIAKGLDMIPALSLRATEVAEALGMDEDQVRFICLAHEGDPCLTFCPSYKIGEFATDYIEVRRDFTDWTTRPDRHVRKIPIPDSSENIRMSVISAHPVAAGDRHGKPDADMRNDRLSALDDAFVTIPEKITDNRNIERI